MASLVATLLAGTQAALAQHPTGPFVPHRGLQIQTHFTNDFGRDADSLIDIVDVSRERIRLTYASSRGIIIARDILLADRQDAPVYVLGYSPRMPDVIPGSTSLGISATVLERLRSTGSAPLTLIYSDRLDRIDCVLEAGAIDTRVPLIIDDRVAEIPAISAKVRCGSGQRTGSGTFLFANDVNNPILIESNLQFSWEQHSRTERVTRAAAGIGMQADMEQSLRTLGAYDVYGLHFDFDKAELRPDTAQLVREIAVMLHANPNWVLQVAGHTDTIGGAEYNARLSTARAAAVCQALINRGVAPDRLEPIGYGDTRPKTENATFAGRAIKRRVEFRRLDR